MLATSDNLPTQVSTIVDGGGAIGTSIACHLAKAGRSDTLLLERGTLTSGTTWHAVGLVMQLRATQAMTELCRYGPPLFSALKQ